MPIPESQLNTWSKQGSVAQSQATYATIRSALEDSGSPYADKSIKIFLQGSYGNDTNIFADSDVDVVMLIDSLYYTDVSALTAQDLSAYNAAKQTTNYTYQNFKADVTAQLRKKFGASVKPDNKAIFVEGNGFRRNADVLTAAKYRKYLRFKNFSDEQYIEGICFWTAAGTQVVNFPKQHSDNCTFKHQGTSSWFKPTIRLIKNMRNRMIESRYLAEGVAPSYFLEGMLYNVPQENFGTTYEVAYLQRRGEYPFVCLPQNLRALSFSPLAFSSFANLPRASSSPSDEVRLLGWN